MGFFAAYGDARNALNSIETDELARQRTLVADEEAKLKRFREAESHRIAQQTPEFQKGDWEIPTAEEAQPQRTGGGAGYVPRGNPTAPPVTKRTDRPDQLPNEMSKFLRQGTTPAVVDPGLEALSRIRKAQAVGARVDPADEKAYGEYVSKQRKTGWKGSPSGPTPRTFDQAKFDSLMAQNNTYSAEVVPPQPVSQPAGGANAPRAVRNNNPGNLKFAGQPGATADKDGFAVFRTPEEGAAAADRQLAIYMQRDGLNTIRGIVGKWSPVADPNNPRGSTDNYIAHVAKQLGISPDQPLSPADIPRLRQAMAQFEAGPGVQVASAAAPAAPSSGQPQMGQPAAAQQPDYANTTFGAARPSIPNMMVQRELEILKQRMAVAPDANTAWQLRAVYQSAQIGNMVARAGTDMNALRDLAHNAGVMVGRVGNGFVMLANDPVSGKMVPTGAPVPASALAQQIQLKIDPVARAAHQKYRMELDMEIFKARSELEKEMEKARISGDYKLTETAMNNANALRTKLMELEQAKVNVDQLNGGAYVTRGSEVTYMKPGQPTKMGASQPTTTAVQ